MVPPKKWLLPVFVLLILIFVVIFINDFSYPHGGDFRNHVWAPAHLLVNGQNPYDIGVLYENFIAVWLPMAIVPFFPLGFLPLQQASNAWWMINLIGLIALVWVSTGTERPPKTLLTISLFAALLFPPTISHFDLGQITILVCLVLILLAFHGETMHPLMAAFLIVFSMSKPQLALLVLPGYFYASLKTRGFSETLRLFFLVLLAAGIFTLPLFIFSPDWLGSYIRNFNSNHDWAHPSSFYMLRSNFNQAGVAVWALLFLGGFWINLRIWDRLPKKEAMLWSLALTPLVTPYVWSWDFVFVLPLMIYYLFNNSARLANGVLYFAYLITWGSMIGMKLTGYMAETYFWWVPWYIIAMVIISRWVDARSDTESSI